MPKAHPPVAAMNWRTNRTSMPAFPGSTRSVNFPITFPFTMSTYSQGNSEK